MNVVMMIFYRTYNLFFQTCYRAEEVECLEYEEAINHMGELIKIIAAS